MNNKVWLIVKEEDFFYDDRYTDVDVFKTKEDAVKFLEDYVDIILYDLEKDYNGSKYENDPAFEDEVEINRCYKNKCYSSISIYLEDAYYIKLEIQEKEVMSVK